MEKIPAKALLQLVVGRQLQLQEVIEYGGGKKKQD